ncbi:MAG: tetratricopeptide repeat protein [Planctomycetota bacterium]
MRIALVLSLLAALFIASCGDDEMTPAGDGDTTKPAADTTKPDKPAKKRPRMSPDATLVKTELKMVENMQDYEKQLATAREKAAQHSMKADDTQFYVGELYKIAQDPAGAAKAFERFARGCPDSVNHKTALYYAGLQYVDAGEMEKAESFHQELVAKYPERTDLVKSLGKKLGEGFAAAGDAAKAITYLKDASNAGDAFATIQLIQMSWIEGDFDAARAAAAKLVEINAGAKPKEQERAAIYKAIADRCGKPAKEFSVEGWAENADFNASDYKGKVYVVYLWKMPVWNNAVQTTKVMAWLNLQYGEKGLKFVGLNRPGGLDPEDRNAGSGRDLSTDAELRAISVWASQDDFGVKWPLGLCQGDADFEFYGWWGGSIPAIALVDKQGRLRFVQHGVGPFGDKNPIPMFQAAIRKCLAE